METTIIALLVFVIGLFVGFFFRDFKSRQTDDVTESVKLFGDVRQTLGELTATTRKIEEVGRGIAELQDILKSPNLRGLLGETLLVNLLEQMLPMEYFSSQYCFRDGQKVDAAIFGSSD